MLSEVAALDAFVAHAGQDSKWLKALALVYVANMYLAAGAALSFVLLLASARSGGAVRDCVRTGRASRADPRLQKLSSFKQHTARGMIRGTPHAIWDPY